MRKMIAAALAVGMAAMTVTGCSSSKSESKETTKSTTEAAKDTEVESTSDQKTFTVGFDAEFPPYGYRDENGEYVGFDLELAEEVCNRQGWELVKQPIDWDSKDMELDSGAIDCIWNGFTMNGREDEYTWSEPYIDNSIHLMMVKDGTFNKIADKWGLSDSVCLGK